MLCLYTPVKCITYFNNIVRRCLVFCCVHFHNIIFMATYLRLYVCKDKILYSSVFGLLDRSKRVTL